MMDDLKTLDVDSLEKWLLLEQDFINKDKYFISTLEAQMKLIRTERRETLLSIERREKEISMIKRELKRRRQHEH